jgi:DNA-binding NarL/FixJ family response regulator
MPTTISTGGENLNINLILVDDHQVVREGLRSLFAQEQNITIVAEASDGESAIRLALEKKPDIVLMDIRMRGIDGREATRRIVAENPAIKVIALSLHHEQRMVLDMLEAGASGYLLKDCAFQEVILAIRTVASNALYLNPKLATPFLKAYLSGRLRENSSKLAALTPQEREVLRLVSEGKSSKDAAVLMSVSSRTVDAYRQQLMDKLDIHNVADLTKFAVREGLTSI